MTAHRRTARAIAGLSIVLAFAVALGACAGNRSDTLTASERLPAAPAADEVASQAGGFAAAATTAPGRSPSGGNASGKGQPGARTPIGQERREIIRTASLQLQVRDVRSAIGRAETLVAGLGGYASQVEGYFGDDSDGGSATATYRVPPDKLDQLTEALNGLGKLLSRNVSAEDVTSQVVDLEGRLKALRASADRLTTLLSTAPDSKALVEIEAELSRRESEIESLTSQLNTFRNRVGLSTLQVTFSVVAPPASPSKNVPGFRRGFRTGWAAFVNTGSALATAGGALLPWLIPGIPLLLVGVLIWRRRRPRSHPMSAGGGGSQSPAEPLPPSPTPAPSAAPSDPSDPTHSSGSPSRAVDRELVSVGSSEAD